MLPPVPENDRSVLALSIIAFAFVILATLAMFSGTAFTQLNPAVAVDQDASSGELMQINLQAKMLVAQQAFGSPTPPVPGELNVGPPEARYCFSILKAEFDSPEAGLQHLKSIDSLVEQLDYNLTGNQLRLRGLVGELLDAHDSGDYDSSFLPIEDQEFLADRLGYCGRLALYPEDSTGADGRQELVSESTTALLILSLAFLFGLVAGIAGLVVAIVFLVRLNSGKMPGTMPVPCSNGGIYIETFALWLLVFVGLQFGAAALLDSMLPVAGMFVTAAIFFFSLIVLAWPMIRGIAFADVFRDIGWRVKNPIVEALFGAVSYMAMLPLMVAGLVCAVILMAIMAAYTMGGNELSSLGPQGHPIQEQIATGDPLLFLGVFLTACVAAPIVEETMFRGVLYRYLRESSCRRGKAMSVAVSAMVSSLIFAAIHPQGIFGIPILTTLAIGFSLTREWRDSLIGPIVMHAINNTVVTCLLFSIM